MQAITQLFEIISLRRKVGDLDYDPSVALISGAVLIAMGAYINSLTGEITQPFALSATQYLAQAALLYALLSAKAKANRFTQTISAIFGTTVILQLASLSAAWIGLGIISVGLTIWNFYISIVILRDSLETETLFAFLWTLALNAVSVLIIVTLFPDFADMLQATIEKLENPPSPS